MKVPRPIVAPLSSPVRVNDEDHFVVPRRIEFAAAERAARDEALGGLLRPEDVKTADMAPPVLVYLPFWRLRASADGFHLGLSQRSRSDGSFGGFFPTGGANHKEGVILLQARRHFPYPPTLMELGSLFFASAPSGGLTRKALHINVEEMARWSEATPREGEIIDPDVTRADAEVEAKRRILRAVMPQTALYAKYEPSVSGAALVHYPLFVVPYDYDGHAKRHAGEAYYVTLSGRSGEVVGAQHPSAVKAVARKLRKLISF